MGKLNLFQERAIADAVERFDPENWRTHVGPCLPPPLEDHATKIKGMAELLRNEESYKDDKFLHGLSDDNLVLIWSLKSLSMTKCEFVWRHDDDTSVMRDSDDGNESMDDVPDPDEEVFEAELREYNTELEASFD
ncbi:hypothetical protein K504DRAFT_22305 [Pleomassaria siparia CBS 279.74]|uniref:Uncharacterized protein n=1 Tax=Pleomassaria siparia CBS 279.74 TaxID=1314801 RepID=A0A6G1KQP7_9PLEO|nr:hypothetical protein K504DRAFT_22305 [Pleomassaria siparia CBS 279.74]